MKENNVDFYLYSDELLEASEIIFAKAMKKTFEICDNLKIQNNITHNPDLVLSYMIEIALCLHTSQTIQQHPR